MRTITLELLRHGPPHNQLLSPLTQYLALCGNHGAVTAHVPFEHNQLLYRLRALSYELEGTGSREFQLKDTAQVLGRLLATIPGLTADLSKKAATGEQMAHFRLIISASELALLPFELAVSPNGFPGAGQSLLLQSQLPLSLTREVRRVREQHADLLRPPKILFASAAPAGVDPVPVEAHLLALRQKINPWVGYYEDEEECAAKVAEHLVFLPRASADSLQEACATGRFTHVHLLAHGVKYEEGKEGDVRYGLALHNSRDPNGPFDTVSGARLATLLRAFEIPESKGLALPEVVTLASCQSGSVGSVAGAGASIAHALHEAGIPIVIGSQFPLSFEASVMLVEIVYNGLLWGIDPRTVIADLRRQLQARIRTTHDWASVVAYASLSPTFEVHLDQVQIEQAKRSIDVAMNHADKATERLSDTLQSGKMQGDTGDEHSRTLLERANRKIDKAKQRLSNLREQIPGEKKKVFSQLASTDKRHAEIYFAQSKLQKGPDREKSLADSLALLNSSLDYYWTAFLLNRSNPWAMVQYLSLSIVLRRTKTAEGPEEAPARDSNSMWTAAHLLAQNDLQSEDPEERVWAHANLLELYLLSLALPGGGNKPTPAVAKRQALEHTQELRALAGRGDFNMYSYSTRRQILRYREWFSKINKLPPQLIDLAGEIYDVLCEDAPADKASPSPVPSKPRSPRS
jgi:hypothetical protein